MNDPEQRRKHAQQGTSTQPAASNKQRKHPQEGSYREHHYYHYDQSNGRENSNTGHSASETTDDSSRPDLGKQHPYFANTSDDVTGLRQLILDNAAICFPHLVDECQGSATAGFKISVLPLYWPLPQSKEEAQMFDYMAVLAYRRSGTAKHKQIARGGQANNIPAALQSLLAAIGDGLTNSTAGGPLLELSGGVYRSGFGMRGACVDGLAKNEGQQYHANQNRGDGRRQGSGRRQSPGKWQDEGRRLSSGRKAKRVA